MTATPMVEHGSGHVVAGADRSSTTCDVNLRKVVDGLFMQAMTAWADHAPNGAVVIVSRLMGRTRGPVG